MPKKLVSRYKPVNIPEFESPKKLNAIYLPNAWASGGNWLAKYPTKLIWSDRLTTSILPTEAKPSNMTASGTHLLSIQILTGE